MNRPRFLKISIDAASFGVAYRTAEGEDFRHGECGQTFAQACEDAASFANRYGAHNVKIIYRMPTQVETKYHLHSQFSLEETP